MSAAPQHVDPDRPDPERPDPERPGRAGPTGSGAAPAPLRVLLAFDSFKGSLGAAEACAAAAGALRERFGARVAPIERPLADGGEGSLELLRERGGLEEVAVSTVDAIGRPLEAAYLRDPERRTAYIEVARAIGLPGVADAPLRPLDASSYGAGVLVADALGRGAERLVVFLGGSATTDGGAGIAAALGARLRDGAGAELPRGGGALADLAEVDWSGVTAAALAAEWTFVADVDAPLLGPTGAAHGYAPQKGADPAQVAVLEAALDHASALLERAAGVAPGTLRDRAGAGAAGGMALLPAALAAAGTGSTRMLGGGPFLAAETGALAALETADLVLTGEGRFDAQSLDGKVVGTLALAARVQPHRPPVVVIAGDVSAAAGLRRAAADADDTSSDPDSGADAGRADPMAGIAAVFGIAEGPAALDDLRADAAGLLGRRAAEAVGLVLAARA